MACLLLFGWGTEDLICGSTHSRVDKVLQRAGRSHAMGIESFHACRWANRGMNAFGQKAGPAARERETASERPHRPSVSAGVQYFDGQRLMVSGLSLLVFMGITDGH